MELKVAYRYAKISPRKARLVMDMIRGRNVLIATGSAPRELAVDGLAFDGQRVLSSEEVLQLAEVPKRVAVIGGGAIGCEFASFFVDTGAEVTIAAVAFPVSKSEGLGLMRVRDDLQIAEFVEKPKDPKVRESLAISPATAERSVTSMP